MSISVITIFLNYQIINKTSKVLACLIAKDKTSFAMEQMAGIIMHLVNFNLSVSAVMLPLYRYTHFLFGCIVYVYARIILFIIFCVLGFIS